MPAGAVYVGRGSKWGNPFVVGKDGPRATCIQLYVGLSAGYLCISKSPAHVDAQHRVMKALQRVQALEGQDLACWCRLDQLCHADVLLRLANGQSIPEAWRPVYSPIG